MKPTREALEAFRDTVLHQRGALAENGMTNDQVNDVLSEFDACFDTAICQSAGAVAPGECGSVPFTFHELDLLRQWFNAVTDLNRAYLTPDDDALMLKIALLQHGMQPPTNQPNSDHVAVIGAKPDSDHLDKPVETSTDTSLKTWPERIYLQAGDEPLDEYNQYSEITWCEDPACDTNVEYVRADLQSGISSPTHRPNEKDVVGEGKQ